MKKRLKKDIVIPAGTVFDEATENRTMHGGVETVIGLSRDTSGYVTYFPDNDPELAEWFEDVE